MKTKIVHVFGFLAIFVLVFSPMAAAQPRLPSPGITPDSPLYFLDRAFDRFQSSEAVASERVAEIKDMAERNNSRAMESAVQGYEGAMQRVERETSEDPNEQEEKVRQASNHIAHFANLSSKVPEQARQGISRAMETSARLREGGLSSINRTDPQRARNVAANTLEEVLANTPEQARQGLETALENVRRETGGGRIGPAPNVNERGPNGSIDRDIPEDRDQTEDGNQTQDRENENIPS